VWSGPLTCLLIQVLINWIAKTSNYGWYGLAISSDGNIIVATSVKIFISTDSGMTWTERASWNQSWGAIAMSSDETKMAAVMDGG
jgi:hypothetical protein